MQPHKKINKAKTVQVTARPTEAKNPLVSSASRNNYTTSSHGESHCCGVRIVLNTTFTAGRLTATIFVMVYGLGSDEMSFDELVTVLLQGLIVAGDRNIYSIGTGYLTFVHGKYYSSGIPSKESDDLNLPIDSTTDIPPNDTTTESSEAKFAHQYHQLVYHTFIDKIRKSVYNMSERAPIPDSYRAILWMDGANLQIKSITSEENLKKEEERKITCCKHSAARTTVEQPADAAPNFKDMKQILRKMDNPHCHSNCFVHELESILKKLEEGDISTTKIVRLRSHKNKAIVDIIAISPEATGTVYTVENKEKGFLLTGMIDAPSNSVPVLNCSFIFFLQRLATFERKE